MTHMEATRSTDSLRPQAEPVYLESSLLRVFGVLFCHNPKRARSRTGKIEINRELLEDYSMSFTFDPETSKFNSNGREIGEHRYEDGKSYVRLTIEYETTGEWIVPLSWLAHGLSLLPENLPKEPDLRIETPQDGIDREFDVSRFLTEKIIRRGGYIWDFHKTDVDTWPSPLHGHDYDKNLKLDAVTGNVYDVVTRQCCKTLKPDHLKTIQSTLRTSKDFEAIAKDLLGKDADSSRDATSKPSGSSA
jgi:hypothetical protein